MEELPNNYALNDGEIRSLKLSADYSASSDSKLRQATIETLIRKKNSSGKYTPCLLKINLSGVHKIVIKEEFDAPRYSDFILKKLDDGRWYLSFDPYGNLGKPHKNDNLVLIAESINIEEGVIQDRF